MKRIFITTIFLLSLAFAAGAQDMYYAHTLSRNNYYGSARSVALGNAVTALGGDLGSVTFNPAGGAVNQYWQFTVTPGLLFSAVNTSYAADGVNYGAPNKEGHTKFSIPNIGLMMVLDSEDSDWLRWTSFGVVANSTNNFLSYSTGRGVNSNTSFLGSLAAGAWGLKPSEMPRNLYAGYAANQFGEYGAEGSLVYAGSNERVNDKETYSYMPGALDQVSVMNSFGSKTDLAWNLAFNVEDCFYFGFNLGTPTIRYRFQEVFSEAAQQPSAFPVVFVSQQKDGSTLKETTNYVNSTNGYKLNSSGVGIYGQLGFIYLPTKNLRVGASFQTPTLYSISEEWRYTASSSYERIKFDGNAKSSLGEATYTIRTPYVVDAGVAWTVPGLGLLSVDYEMMDYSVIKYSDEDSYDSFVEDSWSGTNNINRKFGGVSHSVRAGLEVKPIPILALRAGYSLVTSGEKYWLDDTGAMVTAETVRFKGNTDIFAQNLVSSHYFKDLTHAFSIGAGYSSPGSFFADLAVRLTNYPTVEYAPYYYGAYDAKDNAGRSLGVAAPVESIDRSLVDVLLTFGWRF
ncbi:MAG: hypothetical protein J5640_06805 [Bacteroidales bacterium]|nr:hypothetical protein [Bacteroidales bacterium]